jgi:hypothetical protein
VTAKIQVRQSVSDDLAEATFVWFASHMLPAAPEPPGSGEAPE